MSLMSMENLFKKANLDWKTMEPFEFYDIRDKNLSIKSYNEKTGQIEKKKILSLVYKGENPIYELRDKNGQIFLKGSASHRVYDIEKKSYCSLSDSEEFSLLTENNEIIKAFSVKTKAVEPIVDLQVEDNSNYFSNGILSHNTGGEKPQFAASVTIRCTKDEDITFNKEVVGIQIKARNYKNKCSIPFRSAVMKLYYDGTGFHSDDEYIDFLILLGYVEQKSAYFKFEYEGEMLNFQGRAKLLDWLNEHPDFYQKWKDEIRQKLSGSVEELDKNNIAVDEDKGEMVEEDIEDMNKYIAKLAAQAANEEND